jgi:hypothetical protein
VSLNARANPTPGCQCVPCDVTRRQRRRNSKLRQSGRGPRVPAAPVADHVDTLVAAGWSLARIAAVSKTPSATISEIRSRRFKKVDRTTAAAILAVRGDAQNVRVSPVGTTRRLQALAVLGWPMREVCVRAGLAPRFGADSMRDAKPTILAESAKAIAAVYDELCLTPAPSGAVNNHVRSYARGQGWAPALAWDDDTIDDPNAIPATEYAPPRNANGGTKAVPIDDVVVDRILSGQVVPSTNAERREVVRRWMADGRSYRALEALTGWRVERYFQETAA